MFSIKPIQNIIRNRILKNPLKYATVHNDWIDIDITKLEQCGFRTNNREDCNGFLKEIAKVIRGDCRW